MSFPPSSTIDPAFFAAFRPDENALLQRMSAHVDDLILQNIAEQGVIGSPESIAAFLAGLREIATAASSAGHFQT